MTERIHPTSDVSPTSAPRVRGSSAAIQMPENAVRREQEEGLIPRHQQAQRGQVDYIYPRQPPVYEAKGSRDESYALAPRGRRRRTGPCCCCLISFVMTLGTLVLSVGMAVLVVYLVVKPVRKPKYAIEGVEVGEFNVTNGVLNTQMNFRVEAKNENKKIGIDYGDIEVRVLYDDEEIGEGSIHGFYQGHRNTTLLTIPIEGQNIQLSSGTTTALQSNSSTPLDVEARTRVRLKIWKWKTPRRTAHLRCSLSLSSAPRPGRLTLLSSSCHIRRRKFHFLGVHF